MPEGRALYRKWRPQKFADLVGQDHVKQTVINAIAGDRITHAYLFAGPRGTGKTSLARLLAKAINCTDNQAGEPCGKCHNCLAFAQGNFVDLIEIDAASHTSVDDVRDLIEKVNLVPSLGRYKVYIIDEVHMLSKNAFNALLKTLEEPPAHVVFVLATTEVHKLLPTVISRCQYFDFHYLSRAEVTQQLKKITDQEKIRISDAALSLIAENSEGSLRDALSILDQAIGLGDVRIERDSLAKLLGVVDRAVIQQLTQAVVDGKAVTGIDLINDVYDKGYDLNQLAKQWMEYLRELLMTKLGNSELVDRSADDKKFMSEQVASISISQLVNWLQRLVESVNNYKLAHLPQLALEMAVLRSVNSAAPAPGAAPTAPLAATPPSSPPPISVETMNVDEVWPKLCAQLEITNPATGALLKSSSARLENGRLVVELPSEFLKGVMSKAANHQVVLAGLSELGVTSIPVEYRVVRKPEEGIAAEVGQVFDIM
jgi:DNA polymerase-3 subunit gamma/tau